MNTSNFNYDLPRELIAQRPAEPRTHSKLMILKDDTIEHKKFYEIIDQFQKGDVLVLNETQVQRIRLIGNKSTGAKIELMLDGITGNGFITGRAKVGNKLIFKNNVEAIILEKNREKVKVEFNCPIADAMKNAGKLPTPPYIKKELKEDSEYQTVFAKKSGSLACPTAGLHFDDALLKALQDKGVKFAKVCLHVSWDTFLPVRVEDVKTHKMHGEYCEVDEANAKIINSAKRLFVVGTTAMRTLESLSKPDGKIYASNKVTEIFIYPGYKFNMNYAGLITNFHLPKSTLLMMISAFFGKDKIFSAYKEAIKEKYRFFSLGDAMLLLK